MTFTVILQRHWRGGRVVEGARLERVYTGDRIKGSNPFLSAISSKKDVCIQIIASLFVLSFPHFSPHRKFAIDTWERIVSNVNRIKITVVVIFFKAGFTGF